MASSTPSGESVWPQRVKSCYEPTSYCVDFALLLRAVLECAAHRWCFLGIKLAFTTGQIESIVKGIALDVDKLRKIVDHKVMSEPSTDDVEYQLLRACETIPEPVIGVVREKLRQQDNNNAVDVSVV